MKKVSTLIFAVLIGLGFYSLAGIFNKGFTFSKLMSIAGLVVVALFVERRFSNNKGVYLALEILRDTLGGLGSLTVIQILPVEFSETLSVIIMLVATAVLALTMSDDTDVTYEDSEE